MDKVDFAIMEVMLKKCGAVSKLSATTRKGLHSEMEISIDTLYRRLVGLTESGMVDRGIKDRREHTWYVTEAGKQALKEVKEE